MHNERAPIASRKMAQAECEALAGFRRGPAGAGSDPAVPCGSDEHSSPSISMPLAAAAENADFDLCKAIVEQAPDAIIFADRDGTIRVWNRGAEAVFGYAAAEILGRNLDLIIPEPLRNAHWAGFRKAVETGRTKHNGRALTTRSVHKNGSKLYLDLSFSLIRSSDGTVAGALAIGRDCTATHLAQRAHDGQAAAPRETGR